MMGDPRVEALRDAMRGVGVAMRELAPHLRAYQVVLEEVGFRKEEAFALTRDMQGHLLAGMREHVQRGGGENNDAPWQGP